jgi:hypothetical protein
MMADSSWDSENFTRSFLFFVEKSAGSVSNIENMDRALAHVENDSVFGREILEQELSQFLISPEAILGSLGATLGHLAQGLNLSFDRGIPLGDFLGGFLFEPLQDFFQVLMGRRRKYDVVSLHQL